MVSTSLSSTTEYEYGPWIVYTGMETPAPDERVQVQYREESIGEAELWPPRDSDNFMWNGSNTLQYQVVKVKQPQQEKTEMETSGILTATQAKEKAEAVNKAAEQQEKERITNQVMDLISSASAQGKFKVRLPYYMSNHQGLVVSDYFWLVDLLEEAGYKFYTDEEEPYVMTIWWD